MIQVSRGIEVFDGSTTVIAATEDQNGKQMARVRFISPTGAVSGIASAVKFVPTDEELLDLALAISSAYRLDPTIEVIKPTLEFWIEDAGYDHKTPGQQAIQAIIDICGDKATKCHSCPINKFCDDNFNNDMGQSVMPCTDWEISDAEALKRSW